MTAKIMELSNVSKKYNALEIISEINLSLSRGEIVCLLGPSGCGKTTIFRLIAGLTRPDQGEIKLDKDLRIGYVFQEPRLLPWKTVRDNLAFVQQNYLAKLEAEQIRDELLTKTGLADFQDHYPTQLSGGMKQRLELIRALAIKPELLLLDEPFKSVDTHLKVKLRNLILNYWKKRKISLLLITHDPEEAVLLADRIYVLSDKPARVVKAFHFEKPQSKRTLKDDSIYQALEDIIELFMNLDQTI